MLGVPVLAGSAAYAVSEAESWEGSLEDRPRMASRFYAVVAASMILGMSLDYAGFNAVSMLFWSAVLNGVLAPPLIFHVIYLTSSRKIMGDRTNTPLMKFFGWTAAIVMTVACIAMFITM
jgi:Mn2+/Fe2+ NRAMP family transporter